METDSDLSGIARINARAAAKKLEMGVEESSRAEPPTMHLRLISVRNFECVWASLIVDQHHTTTAGPKKWGHPGFARSNRPLTSVLYGGPYRARTDDIHGVNVALYQLS